MKRKALVNLSMLAVATATLSGCKNYLKMFYTVTWKDENGSILEIDKYVKRGTVPKFDGKTPTKATDEKATYEFLDWDNEVVAVKDDVTYTAVYKATPRKYTVTFYNYNNTKLAEYQVPYGDKPVYKEATPTRDSEKFSDYTFVGWDRELAKVTGDAYYTAVFKETKYDEIKITYVLDETVHPATNPNETSLRKGSALALTDASAAGYDFTGWFLDEEHEAEITGPITNLSTNLTIYGAFELHTYEVEYDLDGGELDEANVSEIKCTETVTLNSPTKVGNDFVTWKDEQGNEYTKLEDVTSDLSLKAVYDPFDFKITLKYEEENDKYVDIEYGEEVNLPVPKKDGYTFLGWFDSEDQLFDLEEYTLLEDITLVQKWSVPNTYNIVFDVAGGDPLVGAPETFTIIDHPELPEATREGYDFAGWTLNGQDFTSFTGVFEDVKLVAKWEAKDVTINYSYNGGSLERNLKFVDGEDVIEEYKVSPFSEIGIVKPADKTNAQFKGWKKADKSILTFHEDVVIDEDTTLSAMWAPIESDTIGAAVGEEIKFSTNGNSTHKYQFTSLYSQSVTFSISSEANIKACVKNESGNKIAEKDKFSKEVLFENVAFESNKSYVLEILAADSGAKAVTVNVEGPANPTGVNGKISSAVYEIPSTTEKFDACFKGPGVPVKEGYTFVGWEDEIGTIYNSETVLEALSINLHAAWVAED